MSKNQPGSNTDAAQKPSPAQKVGVFSTFRTIRFKLITVFLIVALIPLILLAYFNDRSTRQVLTDNVNQQLLSAAQLTAAQIDAYISENLELARTEAQAPDIVDYLLLPANERMGSPEKARLSRFIATLSRKDPVYIASVAVFDMSGNDLADTYTNDIGLNEATHQYFPKVLGTKLPYVSPVEYSTTTGDPSLYFAAPIRESTGKVIGVFRIRLNVAILQQFVSANVGLSGKNSFPVLLNEYHVRLADSNNPELNFKSLVPLDATTLAKLQAQGLMPPGSQENLSTNLPEFDASLKNIAAQPFFTGTLSVGANQQAATVQMKTQPWLVEFQGSQADFLAPINAQAQNSLIIALILGLAVAVVGLLVAQTLAGPIVRLRQTVETISAGDINAQAKVETSDEIGALANAFNRMTAQLRDLVGSLEQRVADRTKALSRQSLQLQAGTDVSRAVSSELDADELIQKAVNLIRDRFDLYYVGLFLLDEDRRFAVLEAGTGEAGREMRASAHKLDINDNSMIGWCITHKEASITLDTGHQAVRFSNPLLPETCSELALPLISQGQVIGAMTMQSTQESAFSAEDITILQTMTDQLANGIEKARLYKQVQQRAVELNKARDEAEKARSAAEESNRNLAAQMWLTTGQGLLNEKMRGEQDIHTLTYNVIQHLCKYLKIYSGALYVLEGKTLHLTGTYAYRRKSPTQQYQIGEDIVGQAVLEKETILNEIPDDYIAFSLGQGKVLPKFRLVAPVIYNQQVNAVVALESMTQFTSTQMNFLEKALESVAIALITAQARTRVNELFNQTRQQAEELQAQEEELRATNEELEAQTDSLRASETRLRTNQTALEAANADLEEKTQILQKQQIALDHQNQGLRDAQQQLERKAEELAATSKYKSEFLANMSHELRTPLNSLLILSRILVKNEDGNLNPDQIKSAEIISASGADLLQLINEILDLSKVEAGHMNFNFASVPLENLAQNMRSQFGHIAEQKSIQFEVMLTAGLPESIITDQQRAQQIIKNLLSNAFKFTEKGAVQLIFESDAEMLAIRVRDSGIGMTLEQQQRVFEAFQQADGSTSRKYGGTGLGLTISREMSAKLGGRIELESEPGKGSVFTLYLPRYGPEAESISTSQPDPVSMTVTPVGKGAAPSTKKLLLDPIVISKHTPPAIDDDRDKIKKGDRVLLVIEDDATFAKVLFDYAHKKNFKCILAGDGESGLKLASFHSPDAILLDLKLPGVSGWYVLDTLKGDANLRHIPVHILSADNETMDAYKRGALGFLSKPINQDELDNIFGTIGEFLSRNIKTLLIVEDDAGLRYSVGKLLGGSDVEISEAASGDAALTLLRKAHFDCIILDLTLPDMTGFELLGKINQDETILKCPVIVYTGKALTEEENAELLKYASSVIIKGVKSPERLMDETALFLHRIVANMPEEKQDTIRLLHDRDAIFNDKHILIVDDNLRNAFALSRLLSDKKLRVTIARSGEKALEMLETILDIDLVLMDIMMPEMDGYETTRRIRAQHKFKNLPILTLTANAMKGDMEKCIAAGANDYLSKPVDADRLFSMLRVWLYQ